MSWYTNKCLWGFVGGIAAAATGAIAAKSPSVRQVAVNTVAKGMQIQDGINGGIQDIKDEAEDVCQDARTQAKEDALVAAKMAELEEKVREEVRAEIEAE